MIYLQILLIVAINMAAAYLLYKAEINDQEEKMIYLYLFLIVAFSLGVSDRLYKDEMNDQEDEDE